MIISIDYKRQSFYRLIFKSEARMIRELHKIGMMRLMNFTGDRVYIRFFTAEDAEELLNLQLRNRAIFEKISIGRDESYYTLEGQRALVTRYIQEKEHQQRYSFGIFLNETGELIGDISLIEIRLDATKKWILGYVLDHSHHGKGYMTEAIELVLEYAFKKAGIKRIEAGAKPDNTGSIRVLLKAGFQKVEEETQHKVLINGKEEEHVMFYKVEHKESYIRNIK